MTEQRQKLIDRFQRWLDTNPRKQIIAAECANIAEEYAKEQLSIADVMAMLPKEQLTRLVWDGFLTAEIQDEHWHDEDTCRLIVQKILNNELK